MLDSFSICHQGLVREQNEDSLLCDTQNGLFMVADGVGGNAGGAIASQLAIQVSEQKIRQGKSLIEAVQAAHDAIRRASEQQADLADMATTLVAATVQKDLVEIAWVGDSRAYLISPSKIRLLTEDHNVAGLLLRTGEITAKEWFNHPGQHELTQALGRMSLSDIPFKTQLLRDQECLLLCTDGLSGVLPESELHSIISSAGSLEQASNALLTRVLDQGAPDNVAFILVGLGFSIHRDTNNNAVASRRKRNTADLTWALLAFVFCVFILLMFL